MLPIKSSQHCKFDIVSLGEVMLRLDPGDSRVAVARRFDVWEGGGEYNVARGLNRCFGMRASVITALANNDVGRLIEGLIQAGGVDTSWIQWHEFDGIGRSCRNGLNFTERGFGCRGAKGTSDRGHSAASQMSPEKINWDQLFGEQGVRWLHCGGIFAGLSSTTPQVIVRAFESARRHGTVISYDLNYRDSLWKEFGGKAACQEVNRSIAPLVDVMIGNEEDFTACLGLEVEGAELDGSELPKQSYQRMIEKAQHDFPNFQVIATTLRGASTASFNDWGALCWAEGKVHEATQRNNLQILDRVGGGDSFASGLIYGLMEFGDAAKAVEYGAAHGALAMTTPGDTSMATLAEVESLVAGKGARVKR